MVSENYTAFPRGSEWRRWDLHIHTPETGRHDQFDGANAEEKWNKFVESINGYVGEVSVVGITDYLSVDNYFKFKGLLSSGDIKKNIQFVLPNIELRLVPVAGSGRALNLHCVFNPDFDDKLERRFFTALKFRYNGRDYGADKTSLIDLGKALKGDQISDEQALCHAREQFVIEPDKLRELFENDPELRDNCIVVVANGTGDGASGVVRHKDNFVNDSGQSNLDATRKAIYQMSDAIFSSNDGDRKYFVGKGVNSPEEVERTAGSLKPCFHGSDAHKNEDIFEPKEQRYCWVKTDPTFEGLKQVLYEPHERVAIQASSPESKAGYRVIDRIERYKDGSNEPYQSILLNPNLNCIIGGRSTGKSVFAATIARKMESNLGMKHSKYLEFIDDEAGKIKVFWEGDADEVIREVEYYKQSFMYDVARDDERRNGLIRNILEQHEKSPLIEEYEQKVEEISKDIKGLLSELFSQKNKLAGTRSQLLELGDKKGVEQEIEKLKSELKAYSGGTLTDEESKDYEELQKSIQNEEQKIKALKNDIDALKLLRAERIVSHGLDSRVRELFSSETSQKLQEALLEITRAAQQSWEKEVDSAVKEQESHVNNSEVAIRKHRESDLFKKAERVFSQTTQSQSLQNRIRSQEKTLGEINQHTKAIKNQQISVTQTKEAILKKHGVYATAATDYSAQIELQVDNLKIATEGHIKNAYLKESIEVAINQKSGKAQGLAQEANSVSFASLASLVAKLLNAVVDEEVSIKQSFDRETALEHILAKPPFDLNFNLHYEGDSYVEMSDGKKAFVILKLLLEFSKRDCPIILDQPEDDLDNRSIYTDLVTYLKQKKVDRQIIAVTHNANIVVGADSELIIVANQNSDHTKNKSGEKFEYITGSIEHSFPPEPNVDYILSKQGIREHVCEILEGGNEAFKNREKKYNL